MAGLEKLPHVAFGHPAEYVFGTACGELGTQLWWPVGPARLLIQTALELYPLLPSRECCPAGNSWRAKGHGPGVSKARASPGKGQGRCEGKPCASKMRAPKELKVPAVIWKEAVQVLVSFSEGNDSNYSCRQLQMLCEKKRTSLKLLSGK